MEQQQHSFSASRNRSQALAVDGGSKSLDDSWKNSPTRWIPIGLLLPADSPRQEGEDIEHTRTLASIDSPLPPIIVHRQTMRVIDGMHRLGAALLRGEKEIEVRFFDGTEQEAFVLAVETNITHGLPLSRADRMLAAYRIIVSHPTWSDRAIAAASGLGARTVSNIRRRVEAEAGQRNEVNGVRARLGRDGRLRPLDHAEGRKRASEMIRDRPNASLREIARSAGISPSTALDVRNRLQRGEDPVPQVALPSQRRDSGPAMEVDGEADPHVEAGVTAMLHALKSDPSLRFTESGRLLLRWVFSRAVRSGEWHDIATKVPPHCTYIMADVARRCALEWMQIASDLEKRSRHA